MKDNYSNEVIFKNNELFQSNDYNNEKIAIYIVNIGGYDELLQPLIKSNNCDYYIVSDKKPKELGCFNWIDANKYLPNIKLTNVKKARYLKLHPHLLFKDYTYSIFIDGNVKCIDDISCFVNNINKTTKIAIHPHPCRDSIYSEIVSLKISGKGNYKTMKKQVSEYRKEKMPDHYGLFETNVLVRKHNDDNCIKIMEQWWNEIEIKSERDQLSFTYVLWKNGYNANDIGVICDSIKNNSKVLVIDHLEEYEKSDK